MQAYSNVIVIIPYTSSRRERMSCLWFVARGEEGHRGRGGSRGPKHKGSGGVGLEGKGRGAKERGGPMNQLASLLLCKC